MSSSDNGALRGRRVVVTGGAGFIGSHVVDHALDADAAEVVVLDNFVRGRAENLDGARSTGRLRVERVDVRDREAVVQGCRGADVVFHLAALRIPLCERDPRLAFDVMMRGTDNVLAAAAAAGAGRVVASSSAAVYGAATEVPTPERHTCADVNTTYGIAKAANELALRALHRCEGTAVVALRYFNVYGPRMSTVGPDVEVLIRWLTDLEAGQAPTIFGGGRPTTDFVFVEDVAAANMLAAIAPVDDVVVNVGTGVETSLTRLAEELIAATGSDVRPLHTAEAPDTDVPRRCANTELADRLLGFRARTDLRAGLEQLVAWFASPRRVADA